MKKIFISLLLLLFVSVNTFATQFVEIKISKLHGLISFSESLMKTAYSLKSFQNIYDDNYKDHKLSSEQLSQMSNYYKAMKNKRVYGYKNSSNIYNMIKIESAFAQTLNELKEFTLSHRLAVNKKIVENYFESLSYFLPIYEKLIWNPNFKKLTQKSQAIEELMVKTDYDNMIIKAAKFYGVKKGEIDKVYLSLYPIPSGNKTLAFMLGNVESIGVLVNKPKSNISWLLSATIFHEIAHTLYAKKEKKIDNFFSNSHHESTNKVKKIFNESVATAIGAGWAFFQVSGGLQSNGRWYNNKEYDRYAKIIYPTISKYITKNRTIDQKFINTIINLY